MSRSDYSRYDDPPRRRPPEGLSLSTGRLEGRSRGSSQTRRTRHNPLRDEGSARNPYASERGSTPRASATRHSGQGRSSQRDLYDDRYDNRYDDRYDDRRNAAPPRRGARSTASFADSLIALAPSFQKASSHGGSFHRGFDLRTLGLGIIAVALAVVLLMAIAHIGPFAPAHIEDRSAHLGALSAAAATSNGGYIAQGVATQLSLARPIEPDLAALPAHTVTREDLGALSGQATPFVFSFGDSGDESVDTPVLSDQSLVQLNNALAYYETNGYDVGYLLMDLGTGRGIAGNLDATIYGASSFKGPFCTYVAEKELSSNIDKVKSSRREQIENIIIWSDNNSYSKLRRTFGTDGMEDWLAEAGVNTSLVDDTSFPHYTARQSALMWLKIYNFLNEADNSTAQWLSDTFGKTEVSFLRNGALGTTSAGSTDYVPSEDDATELEADDTTTDDDGADGTDDGEEAVSQADDAQTGEASDEDGGETACTDAVAAAIAEDAAEAHDATVSSIGTNITVRNKAGWINTEDLDAVCDSGIVTINDRDYLMVIMTGAPDTAAGERAFAHLARTLLEIRIDLV